MVSPNLIQISPFAPRFCAFSTHKSISPHIKARNKTFFYVCVYIDFIYSFLSCYYHSCLLDIISLFIYIVIVMILIMMVVLGDG